MHSRIFQISTNPIDEEDYIGEHYYYDHWFTNSIADYVSESTDRSDDIEWLKDCYEDKGISFGKDNCGQYLIVTDVRKYCQLRFDRFHELLKELLKVTIDDFANGKCGIQMYRLKEAYEDKHSFYVDIDGEDLITLDEFVRHANAGIKFYIGATISYHA